MIKPTFLTEIPIAHRGFHGEVFPENSLPAFRAAVQRGFAIETDIRFSKDRRLVVFHDDTLLRMTGDPRAVRDLTATELRLLRLAGSDERIPLFDEFLREIGGRVPLLIEIKDMKGVKPKEIATALSSALETYGGEVAVQSFNPFYVKAFKRLRPEIACGVLATADSTKADFNGSPFWRIKAFAIRNMSFNFTAKPDFISYHFKDLPTKKTEKFEGVRLAWTIRSKEDELYARKFADNIIFEKYLPKSTK